MANFSIQFPKKTSEFYKLINDEDSLRAFMEQDNLIKENNEPCVRCGGVMLRK
jgi:hypothetical protein